jgi:hypothetical protein
MDLTKILAISGKPGLYKSLGQTKTGLIVESLIDGKRFPAFSHERMSSLAEISVFTVDEDVSLKDVLKKIHEKYEGGQAISSSASGNELKTFMEEVLPNYDPERVYTSDIKKIVNWYNLLAEKEMLDFTEDEEAESSNDTAVEATEKEADTADESSPTTDEKA